jgi:DNA-binding NarL/FixJ family response regulator
MPFGSREVSRAIYAFTDDAALLRRWQALLVQGGRELRSLPGGARRPSHGFCLFDLGPAISEAAPAQPMLDAGWRWVVMTAYPDASEGLAWLRLGASGYCNRMASAAVMDAVIDTVEAGRVWAGPEVNDFLLAAALAGGDHAASPGGLDLTPLTPREQAIARQVGQGLSNKVIAIESGISERTVKAHLNAIFRKTGQRNRVQLALALAEQRIPQSSRSSI